MTYPQGRYHFGLPTRNWHSGSILGPRLAPVTGAPRMSGTVLTSPGGAAGSFVLRTTKPDASNAGLPAGWAPKRTFTASQYIPSGTVIEDAQFDCSVDFRGTGIILRRCRVRGTPGMSGRPVIYAIDSTCNNGTQNVIEQCEVAPQNVANTNDCLMGYNYRSYRSEYFHGVDTSGAYIPVAIGTDLRVLRQGDYLHDPAYFCPDVGGQANGCTHNDMSQHHNGVGETWEGCNLEGFFAADVGVGATDPGVYDAANNKYLSGNMNSLGVANGPRNTNAVFQMNNRGTTDDLHYLYNWLSGGITTWNCLDTTLNITTMQIVGNRISSPKNQKAAILRAWSAAAVKVQASGNTLADGTPVSLTPGDGRTNNA